MIGKELKEMIDSDITPVIEFTEYIEELGMRFEKGMRAYIISIAVVYENEIEITVEERDFKEYNKSIEKPNWKKEFNGEYVYKYSELEAHKNWNGVDNFGEMLNEELCNCFIVEDDRLKVFKLYQNSNSQLSYVRWLENKVKQSINE